MGAADLVRVRGGLPHVLMAPKAAPRWDIGRRGRIVGEHPHHRADGKFHHPAGEGDHRRRAALTPAVKDGIGHSPTTPASERR